MALPSIRAFRLKFSSESGGGGAVYFRNMFWDFEVSPEVGSEELRSGSRGPEGNLICLINISSDLEVSLGDMRDDTFCTPFSPNFLPASVANF